MMVVPTQPLPSQNFQVQLDNQACSINLYQTDFGLFMDLYVAGTLIIGGVVCENLNRIVRSLYLGFVGDFIFVDTQGTDDPVYTGLNSRYVLIYVTTADLTAFGLTG